MVHRNTSSTLRRQLGRLAAFTTISAMVGACCSVAICGLAAWDLSIAAAKPGGVFGRAPSFEEPLALGWYRSQIPDWACAQWAYDADRLQNLGAFPRDGASLPEATSQATDETVVIASDGDGEGRGSAAGYFVVDTTLTWFEIGEGLYDRVVLTTSGLATRGEAGVDALLPDSTFVATLRDSLRIELDREVFDPTEFELEQPHREWLGSEAIGVKPRDWGKPELWCRGFTRASTPERSPARAPAQALAQALEPDSQIWSMSGFGIFSRRISEMRLYGWPLRCMSVHGVRVQRWQSAQEGRDDIVFVLQDDHWTDALFDFEHHPDWSFDADQPPATGVPSKPLWLPFLANSLILGAPLALGGLGVSRSLCWGLRKFRGRAGHCPNCGYARTSLSPEAACPECGEA